MMKSLLFTLVFVLGSVIAFTQERDIHYQILENYIKTESRTEINIPDLNGFFSLKCDFHTHTIFSDGHVTPMERINEAWREGLDAIAITDHTTPQPDYIDADYNTSYNLAKDVAEEKGILLIKATEYTQLEPTGHFNLLFIDDANPYVDASLTPYQAISMAVEKGAFVIYNHPGWPDMNSDLSYFHQNLLAEKKIHAMEVVNSKEFYPLVIDYCNRYNITPLSTTDIHIPIEAMFDLHHHNRNFTIVLAKEKSVDGIKEALFANRTIACADNLLVGKPEYLLEMLKKSLATTNYKVDGSQFICNVSNKSDITYTLKGENHQQIVFPANKTVQLKGATQNRNTIYRVINTYSTSVDQIEIPLSFILAPPGEVSMPFIKKNLKMMDPDSELDIYCMTNDAEIHYTLDGTEPNENSPLYQEPIKLENSGIIAVKAFKEGMKSSQVFRTSAILDKYHEPVKVKPLKNGLNYSYFEGEFLSVSDIDNRATIIKEGIADFPDISLATVEDHYGFIFEGYIYVPKSGTYNFSLKSDDGSTLNVSGVYLIDNDGSHSVKAVNGTIKLKKGFHPIKLKYLEDYEDQQLELFWGLADQDLKRVESKYYFIKK